MICEWTDERQMNPKECTSMNLEFFFKMHCQNEIPTKNAFPQEKIIYFNECCNITWNIKSPYE